MSDDTYTYNDEAAYAYPNEDDSDEDGRNTLPVFFLFFLLLLALVLMLGKVLHNRPTLNSILSEPAMILIVSAIFSFLIKLFLSVSSSYNSDNNKYGGVDPNLLSEFLLNFSGEVFFMVFLPPILFNSGYELKRELFFRHLKPIVSFAVVGTAVSGIVTGLLLYGLSTLGWLSDDIDMNLLELLTFGSLITATDTVSVLGVLNSKKVNPHLFSLVFGESALNDAVAIVLFKSFSHLVQMGGINDKQSLMNEITSFLTEFLLDVLGCPFMGIIFASVSALIFKHADLRTAPILELSLYILIMYIPFITAEVLGMSGIVTIFFTGIFARRYIEPNVSNETKHNAEVIFSLVAYLAESCIFITLGLSVFGFQGNFHWAFIAFAFVASLMGRAMSIYPISFLFNLSLKERIALSSSPTKPTAITITDRRTTIDVVTNNFVKDDMRTAISTPNEEEGEEEEEEEVDGKIVAAAGTRKGGIMMMQRRHHTPEKSLDKVIPTKFMHFLWFAGLRGAVAYACARDFPDVYGNKDEVIATTMVIVFLSVIVMGAFCDPLLKILNIRMGVDNEEYMKEWRKRRSLDGKIHQLEKKYVFDMVVRDGPNNIELSERSFQLTNVDGTLAVSQQSNNMSSECGEIAMTRSAVAKTLTGSGVFES